MNKKLFLPILFLMFFNVAIAQRFDAGVLAGFNASQVTGAQLNGVPIRGFHKPGILAGLYVQTDFAPAVFAGMEIKYSQKGARKKVTEKDPEKYVMRLGYIEVPVYMAFRTNQHGSILAGISTGFLTHSIELDNYGELPPEDQYAFERIDLQPFVGFQFDLLDRVKADLRFAMSVLPIRKQPGEGTNYYWHNNQFNRVISLAAYYQFGR
ncbi:MAG: outer membrane beta-barrel protein [Prolixibacteraceae bacterium]|nr:outer membrane beta-barrel protein [Prolixibacteraceae bacterium]